LSPVLVALLVVMASPASADHGQEGAAHAEGAHDEIAPVDPNALPANDLSTSMGSKISAPVTVPGSLHASPKVLNDVGVSNDLKSVLQPGPKAAIPPPEAAESAVGALASPAPTTSPAEPAEVEPKSLELEIAPQGAASAGETLAPTAAETPVQQGAARFLLPVLGIGAVLVIGAIVVLRRSQSAPPPS